MFNDKMLERIIELVRCEFYDEGKNERPISIKPQVKALADNFNDYADSLVCDDENVSEELRKRVVAIASIYEKLGFHYGFRAAMEFLTD